MLVGELFYIVVLFINGSYIKYHNPFFPKMCSANVLDFEIYSSNSIELLGLVWKNEALTLI
jgi:hypothetical protein